MTKLGSEPGSRVLESMLLTNTLCSAGMSNGYHVTRTTSNTYPISKTLLLPKLPQVGKWTRRSFSCQVQKPWMILESCLKYPTSGPWANPCGRIQLLSPHPLVLGPHQSLLPWSPIQPTSFRSRLFPTEQPERPFQKKKKLIFESRSTTELGKSRELEAGFALTEASPPWS